MTQKPVIPPSPSDEAYAVDADQGAVFTRDDPVDLFTDWLALAGETEPNDPNAMALATVDGDGLPDVRVVLLKDVDQAGLTFYTNLDSNKGHQLAANPNAAICFHWKTIRRQVRFRGAITPVSSAEADAYFATRSRGSRLGAWASAQSRPLTSPDALETEMAAVSTRFENGDIPRPDHWSGFRLRPSEIEFWVNRPFRLHDRLVFSRPQTEGDDAPRWKTQRLYP